jgi:formate dehydrogenase iron-sulfur subunit
MAEFSCEAVMARKAILFDPTRCIGCRACQIACKQWNDLEGEGTTNRGSYENPPELSPDTWMKLEWREVERRGKIEWLYTFRACMHCADAACEEACPAEAIFHTDEGFVGIDEELCTGCGLCIEVCPFEVPQPGKEKDAVVTKCDGCISRQSEEVAPACVKACPAYALMFDDRDVLVDDGNRRIEALKANGNGDAYLYGENELGGLNVISILDDSPDVYGLPEAPQGSYKNNFTF